MRQERLEFLAQLPVLLNSSLTQRHVIRTALRRLSHALDSEAASLFLCTSGGRELIFWSLEGGEPTLEGSHMSADVGIVGWVVKNKMPLLVPDVSRDRRFFSGVDQASGFQTRSVLCMPLISRGERLVGALEILNKRSASGFDSEDMEFLERASHQVSLALENAQLYEEVRAKAHQLATLDRRKQDIITVISHEFRTPLNIIQNSAELLAFETLAESDRKMMYEALKRGIERLSHLVGQVRALRSLSQESLELHRTAVHLPTLFSELASQYEGPLRERRLSLELRPHRDDVAVDADQTMLTVALRNLIDNAIRFTPNNGRIVLRTRDEAGLVEIAVEDTGIGIAEEELPLIFEKFYEVTEAISHRSGAYEFKSCGLGIGLSAVREILDAHGVSIDVDSRLGKGTVFRFRLPPAPAAGAHGHSTA